MATITSDNPAIEHVLEKLVRLSTDNGAHLHPEIEIVSLNGQLSIHSKLDQSSSEEILWIPDILLPEISDFNISIEGGKLIAEPDASKKVSQLHVQVFNLMMALFNLTDKIDYHLKTSSELTLRNAPKIIEHLNKGSLHHLNPSDSDLDTTIIQSFFATRHNKIWGRVVLMPIIDCLNHHCDAAPFLSVQGDKRGVMVFNSKPVAASNEVFVKYDDFLDALDIYKRFGFIGDLYPLFLSTPFSINMPNIGKMKVYRDFKRKTPLDASVQQKDLDYPKDLHHFFPTIKREGDVTLVVSGLIIPSESAPLSLRRILENLIKRLSPDIEQADLINSIYQLEAAILKFNHDYYDRLKALLDAEPEANISSEARETLLLLIQTQKKHLDEYLQRLSPS